MEKEEYQRKMKLYESLGALQFQKVVFKVEELKFKVLKKLFPNFIKTFDKYMDRRQRRKIKRATSEEEIKRIKQQTKMSKLAMRQEWNEEKNRNYHMSLKRPTEIVGYLEWNKSVHKKGLIGNGILIPILIAGTVLQVPGAVAFLVLECISALVNLECINIQNYNLCRIKRVLPTLQKRERSFIDREKEEFGEAAEVISKSIEKSETLPTFDEIINNIDNPEQLRQMRELFKRTVEERQIPKKIGQKTA